MPRPKIFTSEFWARRIDALTNNAPRAHRTGAQFAIAAIGQDALLPGGMNAFDADWKTIAGAYVAGVVVWVFTTAVLPPKS